MSDDYNKDWNDGYYGNSFGNTWSAGYQAGREAAGGGKETANQTASTGGASGNPFGGALVLGALYAVYEAVSAVARFINDLYLGAVAKISAFPGYVLGLFKSALLPLAPIIKLFSSEPEIPISKLKDVILQDLKGATGLSACGPSIEVSCDNQNIGNGIIQIPRYDELNVTYKRGDGVVTMAIKLVPENFKRENGKIIWPERKIQVSFQGEFEGNGQSKPKEIESLLGRFGFSASVLDVCFTGISANTLYRHQGRDGASVSCSRWDAQYVRLTSTHREYPVKSVIDITSKDARRFAYLPR